MPTTWREPGVGVHGEFGLFSYQAYLLDGLDSKGFSASSGLRNGRQSGAKASAEDLAVALRLDLTGIPGLVAGVSFYQGDSAQDRTVDGVPFEARSRSTTSTPTGSGAASGCAASGRRSTSTMPNRSAS